MEGIFGTLRDTALIQREGGGTGFSFRACGSREDPLNQRTEFQAPGFVHAPLQLRHRSHKARRETGRRDMAISGGSSRHRRIIRGENQSSRVEHFLYLRRCDRRVHGDGQEKAKSMT